MRNISQSGWNLIRPAIAALTAGFCIFGSHGASAYRVEPMIYELSPSGTKAMTQLQLRNTGDEDLTIEIVPNTVRIDESGAETYGPAEDDFLIFPPQVIVPPGKSQTIQVRYIGARDLKRARAYSVLVSQVPINLTKGDGAQIKMGINFRTKAFVVPGKVVSDVRVVRIESGSKGATHVIFENRGENYARLNRFDWVLKNASGKTLTLDKEKLGFVGPTVILPGHRRIVSIPAASVASLGRVAGLALKPHRKK